MLPTDGRNDRQGKVYSPMYATKMNRHLCGFKRSTLPTWRRRLTNELPLQVVTGKKKKLNINSEVNPVKVGIQYS